MIGVDSVAKSKRTNATRKKSVRGVAGRKRIMTANSATLNELQMGYFFFVKFRVELV